MTDNINFLEGLFSQLLSVLDTMVITNVGGHSITLLNVLIGMFLASLLIGFFLGRRKYEY